MKAKKNRSDYFRERRIQLGAPLKEKERLRGQKRRAAEKSSASEAKKQLIRDQTAARVRRLREKRADLAKSSTQTFTSSSPYTSNNSETKALKW